MSNIENRKDDIKLEKARRYANEMIKNNNYDDYAYGSLNVPIPYLNSLNTIYNIAKINRSKNQLNDTKKYNERDMLRDTYNFLERFLESNKADNQYFNQLDMLYNMAKIGLKSIDKM